MRGESAVDKNGYNMDRDEILLSFLSQSQKEFGDWREGMPIPQEKKLPVGETDTYHRLTTSCRVILLIFTKII